MVNIICFGLFGIRAFDLSNIPRRFKAYSIRDICLRFAFSNSHFLNPINNILLYCRTHQSPIGEYKGQLTFKRAQSSIDEYLKLFLNLAMELSEWFLW